jgi:PleD family two-component response regulator
VLLAAASFVGSSSQSVHFLVRLEPLRSGLNSPVKILVVEDEPESASALARGLEEEQLHVQVCGNGRAALQRSEAGDVDLVLLDVMLPELRGFDAVELQRSAANPDARWLGNDALNCKTHELLLPSNASGTFQILLFGK